MKLLIISFFLLTITISVIKCYPLGKNGKHTPIIATTDQLKFMQRFGYLDGGQEGFEAQYSEDAIQEAILNIQKFGAIEQTGVMDQKTIELLTKKRCGVKDVIHNKRRRRYLIMATGWKKREITYVISNWNPQIGEEAVVREIRKALDVWAGYGNLTFIRINDTSADIKVAFGIGAHGDPFPFDGPGNILAHAFFPYATFGGDIHFDNDENWTTTEQDDEVATTDFFTVAVHELGHTLGIAHSEVPTSIMFPYYKGQDETIQLDYDDIMAMYQLYIRSPIENENKLPPEKSGSESATSRHVTYEGDFESVDDHLKHDDKHNISSSPPDICEGAYDTVAVLRQELFVFKDEYVWRFKARSKIEENYPIKIHQLFHNLSTSVKKLDAVYEKLDGTIALFSGSNYWTYNNTLNGPFTISDYGPPSTTDKIDAVFTWNKNDLTYLFKGDIFWRFNETSNTLDEGYPKTMLRWKGIPNDINGAIMWTDGSTYFFKGTLYWRFDDILIKADKHYPLPAPQYWFGCPENDEAFMQLPKEILTMGYMHQVE